MTLTEKEKEQLLEMAMSDDLRTVRSFYAFDKDDPDETVLLRFNMWSKRFFPTLFKYDNAPFHDDITRNNIKVYRGELKTFTNICFRGAAKTTLTKLFIAYAITNDTDHHRKFFKVLTKDTKNGEQFVTDIYNWIITVKSFYPEVFKKTELKKEERMGSFTTFTGVKVRAGTVGTDQRGQIQEGSRPDFIIYDDFETRKSLRSAVETKSVWDNMEEAKTGLSKDGGAIYLCNYLSERGNVHKLVSKGGIDGNEVMIQPIEIDGVPTWDAYTKEDLERLRKDADDYPGEYLCNPAKGDDLFFDRDRIDSMPKKDPIKEVNGLRIYEEYDPSHAYGIGADVAGGVGLDSSASEVIDFSKFPAVHVGSFESNTIKPEPFGAELVSQGERWGNCILGIENNKFDSCISAARNLNYSHFYYTENSLVKVQGQGYKTYGWNTNRTTKPRMLLDLAKAIEDGHLIVYDEAMKAELRSYTRDDMMDSESDPRMVTKHYDKLMALAIAWQMKNYAKSKELTKKVRDNKRRAIIREHNKIDSAYV